MKSQCDPENLEQLIAQKFGSDFKERKWQIGRSTLCSDRYDEGLLEAEQIIADRVEVKNGKMEYQIKWRKYPNEVGTWESEENLKFCQQLIADWKDARKKRKEEFEAKVAEDQ